MESEEIDFLLNMPSYSQHEYDGRLVENLGNLNETTDRFRVILKKDYPVRDSSSSDLIWAVNRISRMYVTCLLGSVRLFLGSSGEFILLVPGSEVEIQPNVFYRWQLVQREVVLLIMSTPYWSPHQHEELVI